MAFTRAARARARTTIRKFARGVLTRRGLGRRRVMRRFAPRTPSFTETVRLGRADVYIPAGGFQAVGVMQVNPVTDIPQWNYYAELYNQYRVDHVTFMLIPSWTAYDPEWLGASYTQPRFSYALQDTSGAPGPTTEQDVLNDNGAKVVTTTGRVLRIRMRPVPQTQIATVGGAGSLYVTKRNQWFSTASPNSVPFGNLNYACVINNILPVGANGSVYTVYAKIRISLRDPK